MALDPIPVTGTITGTITDSETNEPVPGATVTITGTGVDGAEVTETITSDSAGQYVGEIEFLTGTAVTVSATAEGYTEGAASIDAIQEGINTADIALSPVIADESPTPDPGGTVTRTPGPSPEGTEPPAPDPTATEPPAETPTAPADVTDPTPTVTATIPTEEPTGDPRPEVVTELPSTGAGSATSPALLVGSALSAATLLAIGIRRLRD